MRTDCTGILLLASQISVGLPAGAAAAGAYTRGMSVPSAAVGVYIYLEHNR